MFNIFSKTVLLVVVMMSFANFAGACTSDSECDTGELCTDGNCW